MSEATILSTTSEEQSSPRWVSTEEFVDSIISELQEQYLRTNPTSRSKAILAQLRRGIGKEIGKIPEILAYTINPDTSPVTGDGPTPDEIACYTAITFYASHQQSNNTRMHNKYSTFGKALGKLRYRDGEENAGVVRRFQAMATSLEPEELVYHARGLISLLSAKSVGFNYGVFARDLARLWDPEQADNVRLAWGRDFYRSSAPTETETPASTN